MMYTIIDKILKICLLFILISALIYIYLKVEDNTTAAYCLIALVIILFLYLPIAKQIKTKKKTGINGQSYRITAKIISSKVFQTHTLVIQLRITEQNQSYISSLIINNASDTQISECIKDADIEVCIDPKNKHEIWPADDVNIQKTTFMMYRRETILVIFLIIIPVIPLLFEKLNDTELKDKKLSSENIYFEDSKIIVLNNKKYSYWELYKDHPHKLILNVYDPLTNKKIASIEDKKEVAIDSRAHFSIYQLNDKVYIFGNWYYPCFDIYDSKKIKKVSDKKGFEQHNPILKDGIVSIEKYDDYETKFTTEAIFELHTLNNVKYYFVPNRNRFLNSEEEVRKYIFSTDSSLMSKQMFCFALFKDSISERNYRLCMIEARGKNDLSDLIAYAGRSFILIDFMWETLAYKDKTKPVPQPITGYFENPRIEYSDFEFVIIQNHVINNKNENYQMIGFDKAGKIIFNIDQKNFPNVQKMVKDNFLIKEHFYCNTIRDMDNLIITFAQYGSICMDLITGKQIWKFEPL
jgi:hypothetical protein